jgi:hypothetical protein
LTLPIREASSREVENQKTGRIRDIQESGQKVRTLILARDFAEAGEAFAIESLLIIQARNSGDLMGIKCELTNIARGHHEGRFRDWGHPDKLAGFEYRKPESRSGEAPENCRRLYQHIITHVQEFGNRRDSGRFLRSVPNENGFEFVVYPKRAEFLHFEYIRRKQVSDQQIQHVENLRRLLGYGGDFDYAKVDCPRHDLSIDKHEDVVNALREFISDIKRAESELQNRIRGRSAAIKQALVR